MSEYCYKIFNGCLIHPFNMMISGPTQSGKTEFLKKLLINKENVIDKSIDYIVWFHGQSNPVHAEMKQLLGNRLKIVEGIPDNAFDNYIEDGLNALFLFDDLSDAASKSSLMSDLICNKSHHLSISTICIMHNLFCNGKERKTLLRNCHYIVLMKNKLDMSIPYLLSTKLMPKNSKLFLSIFERATAKPFGYLLIDGHPHSIQEAKYRTDIFNFFSNSFYSP